MRVGGQAPLLVLNNVDLEIRAGEFVSLIGKSGCGKTTLLRMMAGLTPCDEGQISIDGVPVNGVPPHIGFVFQDPSLLPWRTVVGNLELALEHTKLSGSDKRDVVDQYLRVTGLTDFASYPPYKLSGGMQQRVGLARALAVDPRVLLMDEPFGALDAMTRANLQVELARIVKDLGTTVLFVTHDVEEAIFLSDRVVVMGTQPGRVRKVLDVPGDRPRDQVQFAKNPAFSELRAELLRLIEAA